MPPYFCSYMCKGNEHIALKIGSSTHDPLFPLLCLNVAKKKRVSIRMLVHCQHLSNDTVFQETPLRLHLLHFCSTQSQFFCNLLRVHFRECNKVREPLKGEFHQ